MQVSIQLRCIRDGGFDRFLCSLLANSGLGLELEMLTFVRTETPGSSDSGVSKLPTKLLSLLLSRIRDLAVFKLL